MPIAELSTLGAGVSSLLPALRTVTTTTTMDVSGLFRVTNQASGDVLKMAKNGNAWGTMKTATGSSKMSELLKKFKYYRLSLYTFALSSLLEIMLSGNFKEEYITGIKQEIEKCSAIYRTLFEKCSIYIEKLSDSSLDTNLP